MKGQHGAPSAELFGVDDAGGSTLHDLAYPLVAALRAVGATGIADRSGDMFSDGQAKPLESDA